MKKINLFLLMLLMSCSNLKSGYFYKVQNGENLDSLTEKFKVSQEGIKSANSAQETFRQGDWVFIPTHTGFKYWNGNIVDSTRLKLSEGRFLWPVPSSNTISSNFGSRWGKKHEGIDIPAKTGTHFLASEDGVVSYADSKISGYGKMIIINHGNDIYSIYAHAHKLYVRKGQKVSRGEAIGQVGSTGRSTGPHLHFEIRMKDEALNPKEHLGLN